MYMKVFKETHVSKCMRFGARGCMSTVFKCIEGLQLLNGASVPLYKLIAENGIRALWLRHNVLWITFGAPCA